MRLLFVVLLCYYGVVSCVVRVSSTVFVMSVVCKHPCVSSSLCYYVVLLFYSCVVCVFLLIGVFFAMLLRRFVLFFPQAVCVLVSLLLY